MVNLGELEDCYDKLKIYDVDQRGWEQEPNGFKSNAEHVLTHLVIDERKKDFYDPEVVQGAVAPDSLQYAFRVVRWTKQSLYDLRFGDTVSQPINETATHMRIGNLPLAARKAAAIELGQHLHDLGHKVDRKQAMANRKESMRLVAGLLIVSAELQADEFGFDQVKAFDNRLANLRQRFGIPTPS